MTRCRWPMGLWKSDAAYLSTAYGRIWKIGSAGRVIFPKTPSWSSANSLLGVTLYSRQYLIHFRHVSGGCTYSAPDLAPLGINIDRGPNGDVLVIVTIGMQKAI